MFLYVPECDESCPKGYYIIADCNEKRNTQCEREYQHERETDFHGIRFVSMSNPSDQNARPR